jgi:50S ribosomal subunit-associated GTPase HflX
VEGKQTVLVSALTQDGIECLMGVIGSALGVAAPHEVVLQPSDGKTRAWLYRSGAVLEEALLEDGRLMLTLQANEFLIDELANTPEVLLRERETLPKIHSL